MKSLTFALVAVLLALFASPAAADWYDNKWVWGGTGVLLGIGLNELAHRDRHKEYVYYDPYYERSYRYGPYKRAYVYSGDVYRKETRVWPFYKRVETYPVADIHRSFGRDQAVSAGDMHQSWSGDGPTSSQQTAGVPASVNVDIGDNNQNVNVTIGGAEMKESEPEPIAMEPIDAKTLPGRVVDRPIYADGAEKED